MACGGTTGAVQKHLVATTGTQAIEWFTGWMSCVGMDKIMPALVAQPCSSADFRAQLVYQVAQVRTDNPDAPVLYGSVQNPTSGVIAYNPGSTTISTDTAGAMFVRFGVATNYVNGGSQCDADVQLEIGYVQCGELRGSGAWQLDTTTTSMRYQLLSGWIPVMLVDFVKLAAICTNLSGNLQWRLTYRTAATQKAVPGSWTDVTDANAPYTGGEVNTGDLSVSLGNNMWVQFAFGCGCPKWAGCTVSGTGPGGVYGGGGGSLWGKVEFAWDLLGWIASSAAGAIVRGVLELGRLLSSLLSSLWDALFGHHGGGGGCGCSCNPCYEYCPDLWESLDGTCQLRTSGDRGAAISCLQRCFDEMFGGVAALEGPTSGTSDGGGDSGGGGVWAGGWIGPS